MRHTVTEDDTATMLGSGDVPMLATPRLIAWMEAATLHYAARFVGTAQTTVGTGIRIDHHRATPIGDSVEVVAEPPPAAVEGSLTFTVRANDDSGRVVAEGEIDRAIVDRDRFLQATARTGSNH